MRKKAFTLIECLVSILLLFILLTGGMAFYFYSHQTLRWATHKRMALELANSELESIKNIGYNELIIDCPTVGLCNNPNYTKHVQVGNLPLSQAQQNVYVSGTGYKEVQVEITWQQPGKTYPETVSLDTYFAP